MTWPELEVALSDQEYYDLLDEFADDPDLTIVGSLHRALDAGGARTPQPTTPSLTPSEAPTSSGRCEGPTVMVPGQFLPRSLSGRLTADCHAGEPAVARTPSGQLVCHWCVHGPEDIESLREPAAPGA